MDINLNSILYINLFFSCDRKLRFLNLYISSFYIIDNNNLSPFGK